MFIAKSLCKEAKQKALKRDEVFAEAHSNKSNAN